MISEADSWKVKRIRRDGHVRITPCSARGTPHGRTVGPDATLDSDTAAVEKLLAQKYDLMYRAYSCFSALTRRLRRQATPTGVTIRITPR